MVQTVSGVQAVREWRRKLRAELGELGKRLKLARLCGEISEGAHLDHLIVIEKAIRQMSVEVLESRRDAELLRWLGASARVFELCEGLVFACVAVKSLESLSVRSDLERVALKLEELRQEAGDLATTVLGQEMRGAA
jgi:hypothetical protein